MARPALAATRAISVLNFLAAHPTEEFTLSDLAGRLGINVASAHALLGVLLDEGYVVRHPRLRTFALGPAVVALGDAALERHSAIDLARDAARSLAASTGLEVAVTAPAGEHIVFLARAGEHSARGVPVHVGQRVPFVPPLGSVFVAWSADPSWWVAGSPDRAAVLEGVRARGYSVALEAEARRGLERALSERAAHPADHGLSSTVDALVEDLGRRSYQVQSLEAGASYDVSMVAAPVFGPSGEVALAITIVGFHGPLSAAEVAAVGEQLRDAGLVVTRRSRGRVP
jgi:DNA-binding IclR family transcriptional regulator